MKLKSSHFLFIACSIFAVIATAAIALKSQAPPGQSKKTALEQADEDFYTLVDFDAPLPADLNERARRQARAKRVDTPPQKGFDPSVFAITEKQESSFGTAPTDMPREVALPVSQSDAVVIGSLSDARAFLSHDKSTIFSEFTVNVEDVLKDNPFSALRIGDSITTLRGGGGVRFPSGKIIRQGMWGRPLPKQGRRYLFFLKYNNDEGNDYLILTAYELTADKIAALDGIAGTYDPRYFPYRKYDGADVEAFIREVRNLVKP